MKRFTALVAGLVVALGLSTTHAATIVFDDFNVNEGHFAQDPNFSGSSLNDDLSSVADRVTTDSPLEGAGHQKLVLNHIDNADSGVNIQIRHLSGGGTPANNTAFITSAGTDGWIGFFLKTTNANWTAQLFMEGPGATVNGGVPKAVIADGQWHHYEWNLDDNSGGANGWGSVGGVIAGIATVQDGSHTIDSIMLRDTTNPSSTLFLDYVVKSDSGSILNLVTPTVGDANLGQLLRNVETQDLGPLSSTNPAGGALTWSLVSVVAPGPFQIADFVVDPVTGLLDFDSVQEELGTYQVTLRATNSGGFSDTGVMTFEVIIPEPATCTLLGLAMVGMIGVFRRR